MILFVLKMCMGAHKKVTLFLLLILVAVNPATGFTHEEFIDVISQAKPAVVIIEVTRPKKKLRSKQITDVLGENADFFEQDLGDMPRRSRGSGFIVQTENQQALTASILTAAHVVRGASKLKVLFSNGKRKTAKLVWIDKKKDIALLEVDAKHAPDFALGLSKQKVLEGQHVLSIAGSFDLSVSSSLGIVSAVDVVLPSKKGVKLIQTDAAINPDIYTKTGTFSGAAFAIPASTVMLLMKNKNK